MKGLMADRGENVIKTFRTTLKKSAMDRKNIREVGVGLGLEYS